ncbi:hypothetical protein UCMB321_2662 [Pseudomonas batumici]|uniref:Uncharacterized protein n=1 Tax=Pseudomonas batumici TaxID=226910 RepID=A0A0C2I2T0_9PSED|nr:hypothetical protein UCMB321_2662 [Pseudomonas batumici]
MDGPEGPAHFHRPHGDQLDGEQKIDQDSYGRTLESTCMGHESTSVVKRR